MRDQNVKNPPIKGFFNPSNKNEMFTREYRLLTKKLI